MNQMRDLVPAAPFAEIAQAWLGRQEESGNPLGLLATEMGTDKERLRKIVTGKQAWITFDNAEKLLFLCGEHWDSSAELSCIYKEFDLSWVDTKKPTSRLRRQLAA